ncbi:MAG: family 20 glycosylhydrolase [Lachnospiraceae bacterium]|jgi:hexosaminidase|nr:family 20 glycosylhydrolase [Lachnospiraceae bacterium]
MCEKDAMRSSDVIPEINGRCVFCDGSYCLPETFLLEQGGFAPWCVQAFCERSGRKYRFTEIAGKTADIRLVRKSGIPEEAYQIDVSSSGICITASSEKGVVLALTTVSAFLRNDTGLRFMQLEDSPRLGYRGLLLDCVRHFFTVQEVKKVIEEIASVKMNVLHWHLSDDQGFRIESGIYPGLHEQCGKEYYSQQEIREVVEFARIRGVEIIPEIDMPGHTTSILAAYPMYGCTGQKVSLAESGGIYPIVLCPGKEETFVFLENLLGEVASLFPSEWFHIGGDETPDREWKICPDCQRRMEEEKLTGTRQLQGYFTDRIREILKKYGKKTICWNDTLEAGNFKWNAEDTRIQFWSVQYADTMLAYIGKGGKYIYSDMFELYFDYPCGMTSEKRVRHCIPKIRGTACTAGGMAGMECCLWTEHVENNEALEKRLFPRLYAFAENAWTGIADDGDFQRKLAAYILHAKKRGISCLTVDEANPQGEERKREIMEYTYIMKSSMSDEVRKTTMEFSKPGKEFNDRFMEKFFGAE